jgi:hypothetical protein
VKLKTDFGNDVDTLSKIYVKTTGYELGKKSFDAIIIRYFVDGYYRHKLILLYVIHEEDHKKMNIDTDKLNKNKMCEDSSSF